MALNTSPLRKRQLGTSLSEINVTPFVDVMLVLLVIFMVTAPMMQSGIGVRLPQAETASAPAEEGLTLTITEDKYIHIENSVINQFLLEQKQIHPHRKLGHQPVSPGTEAEGILLREGKENRFYSRRREPPLRLYHDHPGYNQKSRS